ncbi:class I SAM-dependent methyltransferase [Chloroflexota bacterium]
MTEDMKSVYFDPITNEKCRFTDGRLITSRGEIPIINTVPRFVESAGYAANWSYQWERWAKLHFLVENKEKALVYFQNNFGFDPLDSKIPPMKILDAGCGSGRLLQLFGGTQHQVWGIDYSNALEFTRSNIPASNIEIAQADINQLPFEDGFFDYIYCGVLIHMPDIEESVINLISKLMPGGTLALTFAKVISPLNIFNFTKEIILNFYRIFTSRINDERKIMKFVDFLSRLYKYESKFIRIFVPVHKDDEEWRKCYLHDFLTAKYRRRQRPKKIIRMLKKYGMAEIKEYPTNQISITAIKKEERLIS